MKISPLPAASQKLNLKNQSLLPGWLLMAFACFRAMKHSNERPNYFYARQASEWQFTYINIMK
jgi:hypothetical protein